MSKQQIQRILNQDINIFQDNLSRRLLSIDEINNKINEKAKFLSDFQIMLNEELEQNGICIQELIQIAYPLKKQEFKQNMQDVLTTDIDVTIPNELYSQNIQVNHHVSKRQYCQMECQTDEYSFFQQQIRTLQSQNQQYKTIINKHRFQYQQQILNIINSLKTYKQQITDSLNHIKTQSIIYQNQIKQLIQQSIPSFLKKQTSSIRKDHSQEISSIHQQYSLEVQSIHDNYSYQMQSLHYQVIKAQHQKQILKFYNQQLTKKINSSRQKLIITPFIVDLSSIFQKNNKRPLKITSKLSQFTKKQVFKPKQLTLNTNIISLLCQNEPSHNLKLQSNILYMQYVPILDDLFNQHQPQISSFNNTYRDNQLKEITFQQFNIPQKSNYIVECKENKIQEKIDKFPFKLRNNIQNNVNYNNYENYENENSKHYFKTDIQTNTNILGDSSLQNINNKENMPLLNCKYELPLIKPLNVGVPPVRDGFGTLKIGCKIIYKGMWRNGRFEGTGRLQWQDYIYDGQFANGLFHGHGNLESKDIKYYGKFIYQKAVGEGTLIINNQKIFGFWNENKLLKLY